MIEARPVEVEGTPEQRLQPFVIERVAGDHKGRGGRYADCEVFRENLPDYIHVRKLHPIDHREQLDIANATSLRAFSDDAMTPRRCCKSSTARCPQTQQRRASLRASLSVISVRIPRGLHEAAARLDCDVLRNLTYAPWPSAIARRSGSRSPAHDQQREGRRFRLPATVLPRISRTRLIEVRNKAR
jgi:hypothetical protein